VAGVGEAGGTAGGIPYAVYDYPNLSDEVGNIPPPTAGTGAFNIPPPAPGISQSLPAVQAGNIPPPSPTPPSEKDSALAKASPAERAAFTAKMRKLDVGVREAQGAASTATKRFARMKQLFDAEGSKITPQQLEAAKAAMDAAHGSVSTSVDKRRADEAAAIAELRVAQEGSKGREDIATSLNAATDVADLAQRAEAKLVEYADDKEARAYIANVAAAKKAALAGRSKAFAKTNVAKAIAEFAKVDSVQQAELLRERALGVLSALDSPDTIEMNRVEAAYGRAIKREVQKVADATKRREYARELQQHTQDEKVRRAAYDRSKREKAAAAIKENRSARMSAIKHNRAADTEDEKVEVPEVLTPSAAAKEADGIMGPYVPKKPPFTTEMSAQEAVDRGEISPDDAAAVPQLIDVANGGGPKAEQAKQWLRSKGIAY
jgi:hypothetical protein